jgi:phosphatidylserine synthase
MSIFGRRLSDYVKFCWPFLLLIALAGATRLALSLNGVSNSTARWFSMTALVWIGALFYSLRVHLSRFGSYKELLVVCAIMNLIAQAIAISGILLAIFTGTNNIFSAPEFAFGGNGATWFHLIAHLLVGTTLGSLMPWAVGSGILAGIRRFSGSGPEAKQEFAKSR